MDRLSELIDDFKKADLVVYLLSPMDVKEILNVSDNEIKTFFVYGKKLTDFSDSDMEDITKITRIVSNKYSDYLKHINGGIKRSYGPGVMWDVAACEWDLDIDQNKIKLINYRDKYAIDKIMVKGQKIN